jgi:hypothetical protein
LAHCIRIENIADITEADLPSRWHPLRRAFMWGRTCCLREQAANIRDIVRERSANAGVEPRRGSDVGSDPLLDALDEFGKRGGRMVFWTCPNGCRDIVDWNHDGGKSIATCQKCGTSNMPLTNSEH